MSGLLLSLSLVGSIQSALNQPVFPGKFVMWLLFMLSIVSWVMIISKGLNLRRTRRRDLWFGKKFRASRATLEVFEDGLEIDESGHCEIYVSGAEETVFQLLGFRERREGLVELVREAAPLNETQSRCLRYAFRNGFREAQIRLDKGMMGFRFIGVASILLGLIGFVWTLMSGMDGARGASEVLPILGSSLGFLMVALTVATPAILARSAFAMIIRGRKQELRRFHDGLVKLFEAKFCSCSADAEESSYDEGGHHSDEDESTRTVGKKQYHSIRERLLSGPSKPLDLDEIQINPIARQAGARAR